MADPTAQMAPPIAVLSEANIPSAVSEFPTKLTTQPETQNTLDNMKGSDLFQHAGKDVATDYWTTYERVAKQHDDELIERHNRDLDALLIFVGVTAVLTFSPIWTQRKHPLTLQAGLFSSVSSTFIVNMASNLSPQPSDTMNALLKVLINKVDNGTFSEQEASLPVWTGPGSTVIWIQSLAYTSLSMSLLAAFGGVLGNQWLGHFKTSRFGQGSLHERCIRRQQKVDGMNTWYFNTTIATLPILLQLSLCFFGVALAANIWTLQHTIASVIMGTISFGVIFYFFTVVAALKSPDCPFQTPVSTALNRALHVFRETIKLWAHRAHPKSWASLPSYLHRSLRAAFQSAKDIMVRSVANFLTYLSRLLSALWPRQLSPTGDPESAGGSEELTSSVEIDLYLLGSSTNPPGAHSIQWIIEMSTDTDIITAAAMMVPEVEWPDGHDVTFVLNQLTSQLRAYTDYTWANTPHTRERVRTYMKAIFHLYIERGLRGPLNIQDSNLLDNDYHIAAMPLEQDFQLICCAMVGPHDMDIASLPFSDRLWMAHILRYRLRDEGRHPYVNPFVYDFIDKCLHDPKSPPRLVADCLLLAGFLVGLRSDLRFLAKIDKSAAMWQLQGLVIDRTLHLLLCEAPVSQREYVLNARKLLRQLAYSKHGERCDSYPRSVWCLKLCFHLLENPGAEGDQVTDIAAALRLSFLHATMEERLEVWTCLHRWRLDSGSYWGGRPDWHTPAQCDLLVDYLVQVGQGTDYTTIGDVFAVLAGLRGSPSTFERKRLYIQTMIRFMEAGVPLRVRHAALSAAYALRAEIASMDRDDEPLRYLFSRALISVIRASDSALQQHTGTSVDGGPFNELSIVNWNRNRCYLGLLCTLSKEPTWHGHLDRNDHFRNCFAIAHTLSSRLQTNNGCSYLTVKLTWIFAIVDDLGGDHEFLRAVNTYRVWPLILLAWNDMFTGLFFYDITVENWEALSGWGIVESIPSVVKYAMKYWERWDNRAETLRLIQLVEQVWDKFEEEKRRSESTIASLEHGQQNDTFGHWGIPSLGKDIRDLLNGFLGEMSR